MFKQHLQICSLYEEGRMREGPAELRNGQYKKKTQKGIPWQSSG